MARTRDAVDTIKGYYYQFDYYGTIYANKENGKLIQLMIQMRLQ